MWRQQHTHGVLLCLFVMLWLPELILANENAGIVHGLWYANDPFFAEEETRIYVAVRNNTGADLSGRVEFLVGDERIGTMNIHALDGRIVEAWTDWTPEYGEQTIRAQLERTEIRDVKGGSERITVTSALAKDTRFVDFDTDGDGVGDADDADDDNDGRRDNEELAAGTDPLVPDTPAPADTAGHTTTTPEGTPKTTRATSADGAGLERHLRESHARRALSAITDTSRALGESIDAYRAARATPRATASPSTSTTPSYSTSTVAGETATITRTQAERPERTWWNTQMRTMSEVFGWLFDQLLALTATFLKNAVLVQVSLLLILLYGLYRIARYFGRRPE